RFSKKEFTPMKTFLSSLTTLPGAVPTTLVAALVFLGCSQSTHAPNTAMEDTGNEAPNSVVAPAESPSEPAHYEALRPTLEDEPASATTTPSPEDTTSAQSPETEVMREEDTATEDTPE